MNTFRETPTEKLFLDSMKEDRALNRKTVKAVLQAWRDYINEHLFAGECIYFSFGTLMLVDNKYHSEAIMKSRGRGHSHKFRPRIKFNQSFCQEVGRREAEIEENIELLDATKGKRFGNSETTNNIASGATGADKD